MIAKMIAARVSAANATPAASGRRPCGSVLS
jgi:hypothetical protein